MNCRVYNGFEAMFMLLYECYTKTAINPRTYDETICIMFKLFLNVVIVFLIFL